MFMRLGAPHKIDRCANRCSLYPPQAAVAYVARQRELLTDNRKGCPYGLCFDYNFILTVNYHISTTIQWRQQATALQRRRLLRIARNSLWLSLTHYATPPFPQKSRSARLFGCKRPLDGSLSLPTFADLYIAFSRELSFISDNLTAAASHRPTTSSFAPYQNTDRGKPCPYGLLIHDNLR